MSQVLLPDGHFFECPRWYGGAWFVSDLYGPGVWRVNTSGVPVLHASVPGGASGTGWLSDGTMLITAKEDKRILRREHGGALIEYADLSGVANGDLNELIVDSSDRAYVGEFGFDITARAVAAPANLYRVDPDGAVSVAASDLAFPNGMTITDDGRTLTVNESFAGRVTTFEVRDDGTLTKRRVAAQLGTAPALTSVSEVRRALTFVPDGACLDREGHLWVADVEGARAVRIAPGGTLTDEVRAPAGSTVLACMLGGDSGRQLALCIVPQNTSEASRRRTRESVVLLHEVAVGGAGRP